MNVHQIFGHFPVAFLTVYSLLELVRFRFVTSTSYWFYIKAFTVIVGTAGAVVAYKTGELAEELLGGESTNYLIEVHSQWAKGTLLLFGVLAGLYALAWISRLELFTRLENSLGLGHSLAYINLKKFMNWLPMSFLMIAPALIGLVGITVTGALGAAIVYGPDADFMVRIIYDLIIDR